MFKDADVIHVYSRREAFADGVLIDATAEAREAGYLIPIAVTAAVWAECVAAPDGADAECEVNEGCRLLELLHSLKREIIATNAWRDRVVFTALLRKRVGEALTPNRLKAVCGPDDDARPCVTIMLPDED